MTDEQRQRIVDGRRAQLAANGNKLTENHKRAISRGLEQSPVIRGRCPLGISVRSKEWRAFVDHRLNAKHRGIPFLFTFEQWWSLWKDRFHLRGTGRDKYVMARFGDEGAYEIGNVEIITMSENSRQANIGNTYCFGLKKSKETRLRQSRSAKIAWMKRKSDDGRGII